MDLIKVQAYGMPVRPLPKPSASRGTGMMSKEAARGGSSVKEEEEVNESKFWAPAEDLQARDKLNLGASHRRHSYSPFYKVDSFDNFITSIPVPQASDV